jgi:hypothetical protein
MKFEKDTVISHYKILSAIGKGGIRRSSGGRPAVKAEPKCIEDLVTRMRLRMAVERLQSPEW